MTHHDHSPLVLKDLLEDLFEKDGLRCTSRAVHDCTLEAFYATLSRCNGDTRYWCTRRYVMWREMKDDYSVVCRDCYESTRRCWQVRPI